VRLKRQAEALLKDSGASLVRRGKHDIWKLPNGYLITVSSSPSDYRILDNIRQDIRRGLKMGSSLLRGIKR